MFESLSRKITEAHQKDEEKLQTRISRKLSKPHRSLTLSEQELLKNENDSEYEDEDDFEEDYEDLVADHEKWETSEMALLYMIGFVVALSNVWRFPHLCFTYGGLAFFIPYILFLVLFGYPFMYLEVLLGQYTQVGCIAAWRIAPLFKGVGVCMVILSVMFCFNVQTVLAWSIFYIYQAMFYNPLPWISCDNGFGNLPDGRDDVNFTSRLKIDYDEAKNWHTADCVDFYADSTSDRITEKSRLPGSEFLRGRVERTWKSRFADPDIGDKYANGELVFGLDPDSLNGHLIYNLDTTICLVISMSLIIGLVVVGIRLSSKFLLICIIIPYVVMAMLFYRATGLPGAWSGLKLLFAPRFSKLLDINAWWRAAEQVYISTGCGLGVHLTIGSHNMTNRNIFNDTIFVAALNFATSILSSSILFMFLGHIILATNGDIETFITSGPELVFEVMADLFGVLAKANFYAICFYAMIFFLGLGTVVTSLICAKTAFFEVLPVAIKYKPRYKFALYTAITGLSIFASSVNLTRGGLHNYSFQEAFIGSYSMIGCSLVFLIGVAWFYGLQDIIDNARDMGIRPPGMYLQICWKFVSPIMCIGVIIALANDPATHRVTGFNNEEIPLSLPIKLTGHIIAAGPFLFVLLGAIHAVTRVDGSGFKQRLLLSVSPTKEHREIIATRKGKRALAGHYLYLYASAPGMGCFGTSKITPESQPGVRVGVTSSGGILRDKGKGVTHTNSKKDKVNTTTGKDDTNAKTDVPDGEVLQLSRKDKSLSQGKSEEPPKEPEKAKEPEKPKEPEKAKEPEKPTESEKQKEPEKPSLDTKIAVDEVGQIKRKKRRSTYDKDKILKDLLGTNDDPNTKDTLGPYKRRSSSVSSKKVGGCAQQ